MKKFSKFHSKKGFTLVEVMLAVAILAMASLMIMRGFLATMNQANNSTIFSRAGSNNYALAITKMATMSGETNPINRNMAILNNNSISKGKVTLTASVPFTTKEFNIGSWKYVSDLSAEYPNFNAANWYNDSNDSYATHRTAFFYYNHPGKECPSCGAIGYACLMYQNGVKSDVHWVCNRILEPDDEGNLPPNCGPGGVCWTDICG